MIYSMYIKFYLDKLLALIFVILLFPVFILLCFLLLITQGWPMFFVQKRSGKQMKVFRLLKFRTLIGSQTADLSIGNRNFTVLGKFMRNTGLDELPQLLNILRGEMSFVGPRPMPIEYEKLYSSEHKKRFLTKPGLTGLAQVSGKNNITWGRRFELDDIYVSNVSFNMDLRIFFRTLIQMFASIFGKHKDCGEMPVFNGKNLN